MLLARAYALHPFDTIIPDLTNTQSWNRFSYVSNNPINYADPTGHMEDGACGLGNDSCGTYDGESWSKAGHPRGYYDVLFRPQVQLNKAENAALKDLEDAGVIEPGGHISDQYRTRAEADRNSTAYAMDSGLIGINDLKDTPVDSDGNIWWNEDLDYVCRHANVIGSCGMAISSHAQGMVPRENIRIYWRGIITEVSPAFEGNPEGDPRRLPNTSGLPVSKHVTGKAVDISVTFTEGYD